MHQISIVTDDQALHPYLRDWATAHLTPGGLFPQVDAPKDLRAFYYRLQASPPDLAVVALPGVAGLNSAEHIRALCPDCALIWCSDLDFSLQAYRLNAVYFILGPPTEEELNTGLTRWMEQRETTLNRRVL